MSASTACIPVISLSKLCIGEGKDVLLSACKENGIFYLQMDDEAHWPWHLVDDLFIFAQNFFDHQLEKKSEFAMKAGSYDG